MKQIAIISGKGGVGKSTIAVSLAVALTKLGYRTGLLDVDIHGPNISDILGGYDIDVDVVNDTFIPAEVNHLKFISIAHIVSKDHAILWRDKDRRSAIKQLMKRTDWGDLDFIILDFPPGLGSETQEMLPHVDYALIVTVPSVLSESKVKRCIDACREYQIPILGIIQNMTSFKCPHCSKIARIFPEDHSFEEYGLTILLEFPLDQKIAYTKIINEFPVDVILEAMKHPVLLPKRKRSFKRKLLELLLRLQNKFYPEVEEYASNINERVSLLRVVGIDGESLLLKYHNGRISYAKGNETPVHIFRTTIDTFLDVLSGDEDLRESITKGHFVIENASTGSIDLVECEKWARAFNNLKGIIRKYFGA